MIEVKTGGSFKSTNDFLARMKRQDYFRSLDQHGAAGVSALASATPVEFGETARSWSYQIKEEKGRIRISWHNSHVDRNVNVAIVIQYGHATRNGGYVEGRDFINPALRPIFDKMVDDVWKEVTS